SGTARSGKTSFILSTIGGSVAYRFQPPPEKRISIHPDADYYVLAFVKTENLHHARADLAAWFADENGNILPGTELHCSPYPPAPRKSASTLSSPTSARRPPPRPLPRPPLPRLLPQTRPNLRPSTSASRSPMPMAWFSPPKGTPSPSPPTAPGPFITPMPHSPP